ncbi:hypothetical protein GF325_14125 [Candidatus Bathyarchaeota archaeon]|nr:hypothetical protein [Candidatus Bathyarchaeota archaeon]
MDSRARLAIAGAGWSARNIARGVEKAANLDIIAISNHDIVKARNLAREFSIPTTVDSHLDLCVMKDVEGIIISLPHRLHHPVALDALEHGKHVLVEKPIATSTNDAREMIQEASRRNLVLGVYHQNRFNDSTLLAKQMIDSGKLGKLLLAKIEVYLKRDGGYFTESKWRGRLNMEGGSALINQAIHDIDLALHLIGDVDLVAGFQSHLMHDIETEDNAVAAFKFTNGAFGTIQASISVKTPMGTSLTIHGTRGAIEIRKDSLIFFKGDGNIDRRDFAGERGISSKELKILSHGRLLQDFSNAIKEGRAPAITGTDGTRALELIESIYTSARKSTVMGVNHARAS